MASESPQSLAFVGSPWGDQLARLPPKQLESGPGAAFRQGRGYLIVELEYCNVFKTWQLHDLRTEVLLPVLSLWDALFVGPPPRSVLLSS